MLGGNGGQQAGAAPSRLSDATVGSAIIAAPRRFGFRWRDLKQSDAESAKGRAVYTKWSGRTVRTPLAPDPAKSYRLGRADERDIRWGLSQDIKGDLGLKSNFGSMQNAIDILAKMKPWEPGDPPYQADGRHLDLSNFQSQVIACKGGLDPRTAVFEATINRSCRIDEERLGVASEIRRVWAAFEEIGPEHLLTLAVRYKHQQVGGLEAFEDLGALVILTKTATRCHVRECALRRSDPGIVGAAQALSHRIRTRKTINPIMVEIDQDLWREMFAEADTRLSAACRAYAATSKRARGTQRVEAVARISRRRH